MRPGAAVKDRRRAGGVDHRLRRPVFGRAAAPPPPPPFWLALPPWAWVAAALSGALLVRWLLRRRGGGGKTSQAAMYAQLERAMSDKPVAAAAAPAPMGSRPGMAMPTAPTAASKAAEDAPKSGGGAFGWLRRDSQQAKVPALAKLLEPSEDEPHNVFLCAVASELSLEAPIGFFDGVPGVKSMPTSVPKGTKVALLHAAVKAEASRLKPKDCGMSVKRVADSIVAEMVDSAVALDGEERMDALEKVVAMVQDAEQLCEELAPDVEVGQVTYQGSSGIRKLEDLYGGYLDSSVGMVTAVSSAMMGSLMGGDPSAADPQKMQEMSARVEQQDVIRQKLAVIFKIPESKAEKQFEKRMEKAQQEAQKQMMEGLKNMGGM